MKEEIKLKFVNQYFDRQMKKIFIDRCCAKGIETFEKYLSYRYCDNCYYYSGYAILGLSDNDYLTRGAIRISGSFSWENGGYSHGWIEFKYKGEEYIFDSMCRGVVPKDEWYKEFNPKVEFRYSKKQIINSLVVGDDCKIKSCNISEYYTRSVYEHGKLYLDNEKVKKFIAYHPPSG